MIIFFNLFYNINKKNHLSRYIDEITINSPQSHSNIEIRIKNINSKISDSKKQYTEYTSAINCNSKWFNDFLNEYDEKSKEMVDIKEINYENSIMTIYGGYKDINLLISYISDLKNCGIFDKVTLKQIMSETDKSEQHFSIQCLLNRGQYVEN